ncbi:hypothetical protein [Streptomyces sp. C10-9-1]|uniref:hypothetical protein n=1 Tax=Streptomyces sp. C10-9-1 TaxID=1859285 RepID=UPI003F49CC95
MIESVPVRCPACRREHLYAPPVYPCACGAPLAPPLLPAAPPQPVTHRTWSDDWVTVCCPACRRHDQWPQPELGCPCGTVLRIAVRPPDDAPAAPHHPSPGIGPAGFRTPDPADPRLPAHLPAPPHLAAPPVRPAFRPVPIRTARDAVTAAAMYLRWLGYTEVVQPEGRPVSGIDLRGAGVLAQVDPSTRPSPLRSVECLWLSGLAESAQCVFFSLAGYSAEGRGGADRLGVPLFVLDLAGCPQPVNAAADELIATGP